MRATFIVQTETLLSDLLQAAKVLSKAPSQMHVSLLLEHYISRALFGAPGTAIFRVKYVSNRSTRRYCKAYNNVEHSIA